MALALMLYMLVIGEDYDNCKISITGPFSGESTGDQ